MPLFYPAFYRRFNFRGVYDLK